MSTTGWVIVGVLPYAALWVIILWRLADSADLDAYPSEPPSPAPLVSIILPARNEAAHIEPCMRALLASQYPDFELIVVDDHSTDGTGAIARRIGADDPRVRIVDNPELPPDWFGKQWACHTGAGLARGAILLFTDADTRHGPECLPRAVNAMRERGAALFSVAGQQVMGSFWERVVQPHIFMLILARYGGMESMSRRREPTGKIANGQYLMITRECYDGLGGHAAVRSHVAEDLMLAQTATRHGYSVQMVAGLEHLSTRMYDGLGDLVRGWGKNVWAAGRDTLPLGPVGRAILRVTFPAPMLWELIPVTAALLGAVGFASPAVGAWGTLVYLITAAGWCVPYRGAKTSMWYAWLYPLASLVVGYILIGAAWRGARVEWKGRAYLSK